MPVFGDNTGDDYTGTDDVFLREDAATSNQDTADLWHQYTGTGTDYVSLLKFSGLNNLGAGTVSSAIISLYCELAGGDSSATITLKRCNRNWIDWQATWTDYVTSTPWTTLGARHETNDRSSTTSETLTASSTTSAYHHSNNTAQLRTDCENMRDSPSVNYGWQSEIAGTSGTYRKYTDSDGIDGNRPYLTVAVGSSVAPLAGNHLFRMMNA